MSIDIKELLQIANEKAVRINELSTDISRIDNVIPGIEKDDLVITGYDIALYIGEETTEQLKQHIIATMETAKKNKLAELEQLLGVQQSVPQVPKIPKLAPGTEMILAPSTDGVVKHDRVVPEDKSLSKYPAPKKDGRRKYPENMTVEVVRKMYVDEGKTKKQIAEYFGLKESSVNNFIYLHGISRHKRKSKKPDKEPAPDEKDSP